jgi:signal transduction histidine kinase
MTIDTDAPVAAPVRRPSTRLLAELRDVPVRYLVVAGSSAVLLYVLTSGTYLRFGSSFAFQQAGSALLHLAALVLAAAPLVALRWPVPATVLAATPLLMTLYTGLRWPFTVFVALLAVAVVTTWRSQVLAAVVAVASLFPVVVVLTGVTTMVVPYGYDISFRLDYGATVLDRAITLGLYAAAVAVAYGLGLWMRSSALLDRREEAVALRSAEVEGEATVVGERARLARDLHDVVAHHVSLIAVRAETAPYTLPDLQPEAKAVLADIATDARSALDELRGVLGVLRRAEDGASARSPQPTLADVATLVQAARTAGEEVALDGDLAARVGSAQGYVAYRVVQEALTNARRHAPGQPVTVAVVADGPRLRVRVATPYLAASDHAGGAGRGLVGMRERVEALDGELVAGVVDDVFLVEADLPRGDL